MWSVWLVFCGCGFHSVCPLMDEDKRLWKLPGGRDWLWVKLALALVRRAMLSYCSDVSRSLQPHWLQHARLPCPSLSPGVCSNSCLLSQWCYLTISSSVVTFFSCLQSFSASGSFPVSQFFASGGQSIGVSASASILPMNVQDWFPLGWTGWISLLSKRLSRVSSNTTKFKSINSLAFSFCYKVQLPHPYKTTGKAIALTRWTFVGKVMPLLFNMLSSLVTTFFQGASIF